MNSEADIAIKHDYTTRKGKILYRFYFFFLIKKIFYTKIFLNVPILFTGLSTGLLLPDAIAYLQMVQMTSICLPYAIFRRCRKCVYEKSQGWNNYCFVSSTLPAVV